VRLTQAGWAFIVSRFGLRSPVPLVQRYNWFCRCGGVAQFDAKASTVDYCGVEARAVFSNASRNQANLLARATPQKSFGYIFWANWEAKSAPA